MRKPLEDASNLAANLPDDQQDALGKWLADEIESERIWGDLLARSGELLDDLVAEAEGEYAAGRTRPLEFDE